ncbi:MAG: amidase family protein [Alphaproteobacteria bacterium]|nr:amidase family protein [Alphaproteobacteria bacterium]
MTGFAEYARYDAIGLADLIRRKQVSAEEVLEAAIARIERLNPKINAIIRPMYDQARNQVARGLPKGPLAGAPYALKDLGALYSGVPTLNCSRLCANDPPAGHHSTITERLLAAGLVILGKASTPEMGLCMTTEPVLYGPTRNPWNTDYSAGGSSGGSGAAVSSCMVPAAHGSDGGGSLRVPSSNGGLFGYKPTRGRTPAGPDAGEGWSGLSIEHAVARSVRDSAAILDATQGPAPGDPYSAPQRDRPYLAEMGEEPGRLRIALTTKGKLGEAIDPECVQAAKNAARLCESLGHEVVEAAPDYDAEAVRWALKVIITSNMTNLLATIGRARGRAVGAGEVERVTWQWAEDGKRMTGADYARAVQVLHATGRKVASFFSRFDVALSPTLASPPVKLGVVNMMRNDPEAFFDDLFDRLPFTPLYNVTGGPAMTVPLHWTASGMPVGAQFGGDFGDDVTLFRLASQLETAQPWIGRFPATMAA